jgi:hypothetical protein
MFNAVKYALLETFDIQCGKLHVIHNTVPYMYLCIRCIYAGSGEWFFFHVPAPRRSVFPFIYTVI